MSSKKYVPGRLASAALLVASAQVAFAQQADGVKQLDTVVVTAGGFEQMIKDAPASISVITREELEKSHSITWRMPWLTWKGCLLSAAARPVA
ncbi:hypothetical protein [Neopusillimonas aromaticivorans]|uniref:hypothetical protein n=1 Tax=Neopusillimonas aromaticivorans TaxID=2979868 RepID=UPI00259685F7|nr:hypothetical protein [Neopusillimonas aromaticivorans]WJJ94173.1 hypothetical protein N7E01_03475 [Neopusillimonas aromaticivorans]